MAPQEQGEREGWLKQVCDLGLFGGGKAGDSACAAPKKRKKRDYTKSEGFKAFLKDFAKKNCGLAKAELLAKAKCRYSKLTRCKKDEWRMKVSIDAALS